MEGRWEMNASGARARELPRRRFDHSPISQAASIRTTEDHLESSIYLQNCFIKDFYSLVGTTCTYNVIAGLYITRIIQALYSIFHDLYFLL